ncbi:MAG: formate transporter FocA [Anaerolineales bacterium]|nr:formate transporter FocA [Anaerolineales bacterium]
MATEVKIDAILPSGMAKKAEYIGISKAEMPFMNTLMLAVMAGGFIALGAVFATTVAAGQSGVVPYGITKMLVGLVFSLGLILVVVAGAELFTGNNLIMMAWASKKVTTLQVLRNWGIVYLGNFIGSVLLVVFMFLSRQYTFGGGVIGTTALSIANGKVNLDFTQALVLGVLCNVLVCLAVWLTFSARSTTDKILAVIFPITAFVAAGFEHSVANMFFVPMGIMIKTFDPAFAASTGLDLTNLTWNAFLLHNLVPVTIGNIIGGSILVAGVYWMIFLRNE